MDYNATGPVLPEAIEAMMPLFTRDFGNSASRQHLPGRSAERAVDRARKSIAGILNADPAEIFFTSGATEACNLAIQGIHALYRRKGNHIITVKTEHKAVLDCCKFLEKKGAELTYLDVDASGLIDLKELENAIRRDTILVAVMWANNETGVLMPVAEIGEICERRGTLFFCDATQAVGKIVTRPRESGIQLLALSAHKFGGPKGIGALYVSRRDPRVKVQPIQYGGGHEGGNRSGTLNVPGIVGMATAMEVTFSRHLEENARLEALRNRLEQGLLGIPEVQVNAEAAHRMSHVTNLHFRYIDGEALMAGFQNELAVASGSACTSADPDPSHVLIAMGLSRDEAKGSLRFSLGPGNSPEDVEQAIRLVKTGVERLRSDSPAWKMHAAGLI